MDEGNGGAAEKRKRAAKEPPGTPTPGAQRFSDIVTPKFNNLKERNADLKAWLLAEEHNWLLSGAVKWRLLSEFLSGKEPHFPRRDLLAKYASKVTGKHHDEREFENPTGAKNFIAEFCAKNSTSALLGTVKGQYVCYRPSTTIGKNAKAYEPDKDSSHHLLRLNDHGAYQPGSFRYWTTSADGTASYGSWGGYAVTNQRHDIFLFGLCAEGEDASYFLLRRHPESQWHQKMLVGIQSLLLPHPDDGPMHAVSRPIVAIKQEFQSAETKAAAILWINQHLQPSRIQLVSLPNSPTAKLGKS